MLKCIKVEFKVNNIYKGKDYIKRWKLYKKIKIK